MSELLIDMDPMTLDALHAAVAQPERLCYTELRKGDVTVAGYTAPPGTDMGEPPQGWHRYSVETLFSDRPLDWCEYSTEYDKRLVAHTDRPSRDGFQPNDFYCTADLSEPLADTGLPLLAPEMYAMDSEQFGRAFTVGEEGYVTDLSRTLDGDWRIACGILPDLGVLGLVDDLTEGAGMIR